MWSPQDFAGFAARYPATPAFAVDDAEPGLRFEEAWLEWSPEELDDRLYSGARGICLAFVRGYLGAWMPQNMVAPVQALRALELDARLLDNTATATVDGNADRIAAQLAGRDTPVVLCGHSKGGLECLRAADRHIALEDRLVGMLLCQAPRGPSVVLESVLQRQHQDSLTLPARRWTETAQRLALTLTGARTGGAELTGDRLQPLVAQLDDRQRPYRVWQTASWSDTPTRWLESFHQRLDQVRPGCAHDGQFYLQDLVWPDLPHVLLARVDHVQPAMGGGGFDHVRYWKIMLALLLEGRAQL